MFSFDVQVDEELSGEEVEPGKAVERMLKNFGPNWSQKSTVANHGPIAIECIGRFIV